jgi:XisH protein
MARDLYHYIVREALENDGWLITHDPLIVRTSEIRMEIDLAAEQMIAAERGVDYIVVEVKSFLTKSKLNKFYEAKGQYDLYKRGLRKIGSTRKLYLAVDVNTYESFFTKTIIQETLEEDKISVIIFDKQNKKIIQWINND